MNTSLGRGRFRTRILVICAMTILLLACTFPLTAQVVTAIPRNSPYPWEVGAPAGAGPSPYPWQGNPPSAGRATPYPWEGNPPAAYPTYTPYPTHTQPAPQPPNPAQPPAPPLPFLGAALNEYIVIAQLNFWYYGPGFWGGFENESHERNTPLTPLLGETYYASDPAVVHQQIEWAVEYGVDAFSIEWTTPRGVGRGNDLEVTLDDVFLKSPNINKIRWVIDYDFPLRLDQTPGLDVTVVPNINFDQPDVYNTFVSDFVHFAKKYFGNPQYLTIDGRPVVYIWATNSFIGNLAGAMQEARAQVSKLGYDVFIVGDEVCVGCFNRQHAALFDGSSTFTMLMPGLYPAGMVDVGKAAVKVDGAFKWWTNRIAGLKVAGRDDLVNFQPAWAPQFDNRKFDLKWGTSARTASSARRAPRSRRARG